MAFDVQAFDVAKFDALLARGLSKGLGTRGGMVCVEAALCEVLNLPHGDDPGCVSAAVRSFKIELNDASWSSPKARAQGLRDLGLAQLGSLGVVNDQDFLNRLSEKVIRRLVPHVFRRAPHGMDFTKEADACERDGSREAAAGAAAAAQAAQAAQATWAAQAAQAAWAAWAARATWAARAARAAQATWAAQAAESNHPALVPDFYLIMAAQLALETLRELQSPGCQLLDPTDAIPNAEPAG